MTPEQIIREAVHRLAQEAVQGGPTVTRTGLGSHYPEHISVMHNDPSIYAALSFRRGPDGIWSDPHGL